MSKTPFTFDGHISEEQYKPFIPWEMFDTLEPNTILNGTCDHVTPAEINGKACSRAQVLINGHLLGAIVWGTDVMKIRSLVGKPVKVAYRGKTVRDGVATKYPDLVIML